MKVVLRKDARKQGLTRYFTGKECAHGHMAERQTTNGKCIVCRPKQQAKWVQANRGSVNAWAMAWRKTNPEKSRTTQAKYHSKHRNPKIKSERQFAVDRMATRYFTGEPCKHGHISERFVRNRGCVTCYLISNRVRVEYRTTKRRNRRAQERQAEGRHTLADVKRILLRQGRRCAYCKTSLKNGHHVDHVIPLVKGGGNSPENLQCLCPSCNLRKNAKSSEEYARSIGLLL